jgi:hypothetical protein
LGDNPVAQVCYFVPDVRDAALKHSKLFGSGPYFLAENMASTVEYRGGRLDLNISAAFGQWGEIQVEIVQQNSPGQSYYTEAGTYGFHHLAVFDANPAAAIEELMSMGAELAGCGKKPDGSFIAVMMDCRKILGHYLEIYPSGDAGTAGLYKAVRKMAEGWDKKTDILRTKLG